jgi:nucleoid-associated protein YgaU
MYMFFNKITLINGSGVKPAIAVAICFLFCLSVYAALDNKNSPASGSSQVSAPQQQNPEIILQISTEAPSAVSGEPAVVPVEPAASVVPLTPRQQESAIKPIDKNDEGAEVEEAKGQQHRVHTVWLWQESRDCLWNLSKKYYNDPWQWKRIYLANKAQIADPRKIYPKQVLVIPPNEEQNTK